MSTANFWGVLDFLPGDVCVNVTSQQAYGFDGRINYHKVFTPSNSHLYCRSQANIPVPHNLEAFDDDLLGIALSYLDIGERTNSAEVYEENGISISVIAQVGKKWFFQLKNNTGIATSFEYNIKFTEATYAKYFVALYNVQTTNVLANGESTIIEIDESEQFNHSSSEVYNSWITISYKKDSYRYIFSANNLNKDNLTMTTVGNTKNSYLYSRYGMNIDVVCRNSNGYVVKLTNNTGAERKFVYNSNLAFFDDAKNWTNLTDIKVTDLIQPNESCIVEISENGFATTMAISYMINDSRYIFYADNLTTSGTLNPNGNAVYYNSYVTNGVKMSIVGKNGNTWKLKITNLTGEDHEFNFNYKMCFYGDAENWTGLSNVKTTFVIPNNESFTIDVSEYGFANSVAVSYVKNHKRYVYFANELTEECSLSLHYSEAPVYTYTNAYGITVGIVSKTRSKWNIKLTNNTGSDRTFYYNKNMCNYSDGKNWTGLSDIEQTETVLVGQTINLTISENGFATSIAISYLEGNSRYIFVADELDEKGTMSANSNSISFRSYTQNGIEVSIAGKDGSTWLIQNTNKTGERRSFDYNSRLCFEGHGKNWTNLVSIKHTEILEKNATTDRPIKIEENAFATSIAISYVVDHVRYVFVANELSTSGTMKSIGNIVSDDTLKVSIISKSGSTWNIEIENNTGYSRKFIYNKKMCFEGDAKSWSGLTDIAVTLTIADKEKTTVQISENGTAGTIAISYIVGETRMIYYADELDADERSLDPHMTSAPYRSYTSNDMKVSIIGKNGSTWMLELTNVSSYTRTIYYFSKTVTEANVKAWNYINNTPSYATLGSKASTTVYITTNGSGSGIGFSYTSGTTRYTFYADSLSPSGTMNARGASVSENVKLDITGKSSGTWSIRLTNKTGSAKTFYYNKKMCFEGDGKNWSGLTDVDYVKVSNNSSTTLYISENGTAGYISVSYLSGTTRYIIYANNLSTNGGMTAYRNTKSLTTYTQNGIKVAILGKYSGTWLLQVTNQTGSSRRIDYNSKMCFEGDAKSWSGLSDVTSTPEISNGSTLDDPIRISENGFAGTIALSYTSGNYRYVFYADEISTSGTMDAHSNTIDMSASSSQCVTKGTLITLADGTQKAVEELTGDEMLLVWNFETGSYDYAPILFIDSDPEAEYEVIKLTFSDGTIVNVVSEHGFYDADLNKYVYLDRDAADYIGHNFVKEDGNTYTTVTLTDVDISYETTTTYSPVTYKHLCYYVNGMLSMPGGISGLFNYFDVDLETMKYDEEAMANDIETYGLLTYEELCEFAPVSEEMFEAVNGQYLKIALGKGLITLEDIEYLADRYSSFVPGEEEVVYTDEEIRNYILEAFEESGTSLETVMKQYIRMLSGNYNAHIPHSVFDKAVWEVSYDGTYFYAKVTVKWHGSNYIFNIKVA